MIWATSTAPLISSITCRRLDRKTFNFSVKVVHTGAGNRNAALRLANIHFRERLTSSSFGSYFHDVHLTRQINEFWHGTVLIDQTDKFENTVEFVLSLVNNFGHGTKTTVFSQYGKITNYFCQVTVEVVYNSHPSKWLFN